MFDTHIDQTEDIRDKLTECGFVIIRGVFSDADVERLRAGTLEVCKDAPICRQELTGLDALAWLAVDERDLPPSLKPSQLQ